MKLPLRLGREKPPVEADMSLIGHLSELRSRLMKIVSAVVGGAIIVYIFNETLFDFLAEPYYEQQEASGQAGQFLARTPLESFSTVITLSGYGGLILAMPVILYQLAKFVLPGLYPQERKVLLPVVAISVILLMLGMTAGYLLLPKTLSVLAGFGSESIVEMFSPKDYISFFVRMLLAFGLAAELPLVLTFLQLVGVVKTETLKKNRRIAVVAVVILSAIVTPTGDPFTLGILAVPMYLFFEISIIVGGRLSRKRQVVMNS